MSDAKKIEELSAIVDAAMEKRDDAIYTLMDAQVELGDALEAWSDAVDEAKAPERHLHICEDCVDTTFNEIAERNETGDGT